MLKSDIRFLFFFKPKKPKFGLFRFLGFKKNLKNLGFLKPCQTALGISRAPLMHRIARQKYCYQSPYQLFLH